jgi:hypothetical protein
MSGAAEFYLKWRAFAAERPTHSVVKGEARDL